MTEKHESHAKHKGHQGPHHESHKSHEGLPEIPKVDFKGVTTDKVKGGFMDVVEILKLNKARINIVGRRESEGITMALIYLTIGAFGAPLGGAILGYTILGMTVRTPIINALIGGVIATVIAFASIYITNLIAERLFKGQGKFPAYFRVMGYASLAYVLGFLTIVSVIGTLAGLYVGLVINYFALKQIHKLDTTNAILVIIVSFVVTLILAFIVASVGLSSMVGGGMMGGMGGPGISVTY